MLTSAFRHSGTSCEKRAEKIKAVGRFRDLIPERMTSGKMRGILMDIRQNEKVETPAGQKEEPGRESAGSRDFWELRLYVAGQTEKSLRAFENLKKMCEENLKGKYRIEIIDLLKNPQLARGDQIIAIPTLVRRLPPPLRKIVGDLSNTERTLVGLDIRPAKTGAVRGKHEPE